MQDVEVPLDLNCEDTDDCGSTATSDTEELSFEEQADINIYLTNV